MGCEFNVFCRPTEPRGTVAAEAALDEIRQLEELLTVYSDSSPMAHVNQHAHPGPVVADGRIVELLQRAEELTRQTDGGFDVAAGALVRAWGFLKGPRRVPSDRELEAAMTCSGMRHVELDAERRRVRYRVPGLEINLGAFGKGYAIDRAVRRMSEEYGVTSALIQGGLSSTYAMGSASDEEDGWLVGIQDPFDTSRRIATVRLRDRALGTSAANRQYFEAGGRRPIWPACPYWPRTRPRLTPCPPGCSSWGSTRRGLSATITPKSPPSWYSSPKIRAERPPSRRCWRSI
jgi:thiamine biosynthesis lipoprotein